MALKKKPVTGMKDILPAEMEIRDYVLGKIKETYRGFGFSAIETPCVEHIENLTSKQGGDNEKLIFKILKRGEKLNLETAKEEADLVDGGLRYDLTLPLSRYYSNNSANLPSPFKALQVGSVWRADRPQKGRFRQFVQCDIDILGEPGNLAEIEAGTRPAFLPRPKPQPYRPHPKYKGFLALYYHYCYLLGRIEKRQYPPRMTPHLRREIMKAETYKARLKFLQENGIATADDLTACMHQAESTVTQLAKQRTILNVRKKKRKKLFDALAAEEALAMSKALYEEGLSGMEAEYAQYAEAKAVLDACGISRKTLTEEKADIYEQLAQINKQIRAERQKIKLCREIADSAAVMQRDVAAQEKSLHEKETEHSFTNRR